MLLFPSRYEGFGLPVLEAMSVGTPVITAASSSLPEVAGEAGVYLHNLDDENELCKLIKMVTNMTTSEKQTLIDKGYKQVKKFSREDCAKEILHIFEKLK